MENREIKFRAWDDDRKVMVYKFADKLNRKAYVLLWSQDNERLFCGNYMDNGDWQEPKLMAFTGLKDKNGKEIFELMEVNNRYRVVWNFNRYVLQSISNSDIFVEILRDGEYEITGEYSPIP